MLDENKIKRMVKLASYETKAGKEELEISAYHRRDYVSINVLRALLWLTFGYVVTVAFFCLAYLELIINNITVGRILELAKNIGIIYVVLMIAYGVCVRIYYKRKHNKAREKVKDFCHELFLLEKMYEKENL